MKEAAQPQAGMKVTPVRADEGDSRACATTPSRLPEIDRFTLRAARRGDREAFDAIVDLYADRLRLLASHLLHDADLTDDALQDTFFNAYRGLSGFGGRSSLGTWLYRITYTVCMGYLRRRKPPGVSFEDAEDMLASDADPEESYARRHQLSAALATLSPEQRAAVLLVDLYGFDYGSAGKVLDVPKGTVCSRLNAARASLRAALSAAPGAHGSRAAALPGAHGSDAAAPLGAHGSDDPGLEQAIATDGEGS